MTLQGTFVGDYTVTPVKLTVDFLVLNSATGKVHWTNNVVFNITTTINGTVTSRDVTVTGRFYDSDNGYVDITTPTPLHFVGMDTSPSSGVLLLTGANNTKIRLTALTNVTYRVEGDTIGSGTYNYNSGALNWTAM